MTRFTLVFRDLFDDLVERKLWPVAILLVGALIAVPVVLSKPASPREPATPAGSVPATGAGNLGGSSPLAQFQPVVSGAGAETAGERKELGGFGSGKNPFEPKGLDLKAADAAGDAKPLVPGGDASVQDPSATVGDTTTPVAAPPSSGGDTTGGGTSDEVFYYQYTAKVRFGEEGNTSTRTLTQFRSLPSTDNPVTIFMGVRGDGKTAVFLISSAATTTGDGKCQPSDTNCTFLYMKEGDHQLIETITPDGEVVDYELELVDIGVKKTTAPQEAEKSGNKGSHSSRFESVRSIESRKDERLSGRARLLARAFGRLAF